MGVSIYILTMRRQIMASHNLLSRKIISLIAVLLLFLTCSCSYLPSSLGGNSDNVQPVDEISGDITEPLSMHLASYDDIEIPVEMEVIKSMAIRTDSFRGGVHETKGKVEIFSLRDYIVSAMSNNKWKLVGEANYEKIMLAFTKPNKTCMVMLQDSSSAGFGSTYASFYVTADLAAASNLNPFGEPAN